MAFNDDILIRPDPDRIIEAESLDALDDRFNIDVSVFPRVSLIRRQRVDRKILNFQVFHIVIPSEPISGSAAPAGPIRARHRQRKEGLPPHAEATDWQGDEISSPDLRFWRPPSSPLDDRPVFAEILLSQGSPQAVKERAFSQSIQPIGSG